MAYALIKHTWPDGNTTKIVLEAEDSFPDAIAQVAHEVVRMFQAACTDQAKQ